MGGGTEVDDASRTFVESAGGQDVLVLRATGSVDSYTGYFSTELGAMPAPATVTTLRIDDPLTSSDGSILCRIRAAESLWFAGGDQWDYAGHWLPALHEAVESSSSRITIGGTSAGAMVLSGFIYSAEHGSITSEEALADPLAVGPDVIRSPMAHPFLVNVLVDTHFTQRGREGRLLVFAAHALIKGAPNLIAIGLDEETALVVDGSTFLVQGNGSAWVYGVSFAPTLEAGRPLTMRGILRRQIIAGSTGPWPINPQTGDALLVDNGMIVQP